MVRFYEYDEKADRLFIRVFYWDLDRNSPRLEIRCNSDASWIQVKRPSHFSLSMVAEEIYKLYAFLDNPYWKSSLKVENGRIDDLSDLQLPLI